MGTGSCVSLVFKPGPGTSSLPPTVKTWLDNWFGFDGVLQQSPRVVWVNGGLLDGAQAAVSVGSNLTFVVMFGRSGLSSTDPDFQWFPNWSILLGQAPRAHRPVPDVRHAGSVRRRRAGRAKIAAWPTLEDPISHGDILPTNCDLGFLQLGLGSPS
jgi:hypothetical protein